MTDRHRLPHRRRSEIVELEVDGVRYKVTGSRFSDGRLGEIFIDGPKTGSTAQTTARDAGIALSLLLQHGVAPAKVLRTLTQLPDGSPASIVGRALKAFA